MSDNMQPIDETLDDEPWMLWMPKRLRLARSRSSTRLRA